MAEAARFGHGVRLANYMSYADPSSVSLDLGLLVDLVATKKLETNARGNCSGVGRKPDEIFAPV
jgi:hypothetical protein